MWRGVGVPHAASFRTSQEPAVRAREHLWAPEGEPEAAQAPRRARSHRKADEYTSNAHGSSHGEVRVLRGFLTTAQGRALKGESQSGRGTFQAEGTTEVSETTSSASRIY